MVSVTCGTPFLTCVAGPGVPDRWRFNTGQARKDLERAALSDRSNVYSRTRRRAASSGAANPVRLNSRSSSQSRSLSATTGAGGRPRPRLTWPRSPDPRYVLAVRVRAAVLEEFGRPLVVQEVELAEPRTGEVLVRLVACGVCHTDMYTASGVDPSGYAPCVLGHEGAGVVERVGDGVTSVRAGDHVITLFAPECGECVHCRSPTTNRCVAIRDQQNAGYLPDGTTRLMRDGEPLRHFMGTSTFAEYTVMPEIALAKVNPEAPLDGCAPFACGLSTGIGAALFTARVEPGSTVAVFGCGLVGLGAVIGARLAGAERIFAFDLSEERLRQARHHGATDARAPTDNVVDWVRSETAGFGADYT